MKKTLAIIFIGIAWVLSAMAYAATHTEESDRLLGRPGFLRAMVGSKVVDLKVFEPRGYATPAEQDIAKDLNAQAVTFEDEGRLDEAIRALHTAAGIGYAGACGTMTAYCEDSRYGLKPEWAEMYRDRIRYWAPPEPRVETAASTASASAAAGAGAAGGADDLAAASTREGIARREATRESKVQEPTLKDLTAALARREVRATTAMRTIGPAEERLRVAIQRAGELRSVEAEKATEASGILNAIGSSLMSLVGSSTKAEAEYRQAQERTRIAEQERMDAERALLGLRQNVASFVHRVNETKAAIAQASSFWIY